MLHLKSFTTKIIYILLALILAVPFISSTTKALALDEECQNGQICNNNFENNLTNWKLSGNESIVYDSPEKGNVLKLAKDSANSDIVQHINGTFISGKTYRISVDCKTDINSKCGLFFGDLDNYSNVFYKSISGTGEWQNISVIKTLSTDEKMSIYLYAKQNDTYYNNISLVEIDTSCGTNSIVCNNNFDQYEQNWATSGNESVVYDNTNGNVLKLSPDSKNSDIYQNLSTTFLANNVYYITADCKTDLSNKCGMFLGDVNTSNGPAYENIVYKSQQGTGDWQTISTYIKMSKSELMNLYLYAKSGQVYYDNISIRELNYDNSSVYNGDFAEGKTGWQLTGNEIFVTNESGSYLQLNKDNQLSAISQRLNNIFNSGNTYLINVNCKGNIGNKCRVFFGDDNNLNGLAYENEASISTQYHTLSTTNWESYSFFHTMTKNESMDLFLYAVDDTTYYDNITIREVVLPQVPIVLPTTNDVIINGDAISYQAVTTNGSEGSVNKVDFYDNDVLVATDTTAPYYYATTAVTGSHNIKALVTDTSGLYSSTTQNYNILASNGVVNVTSQTPNGSYKIGDVVTVEVEFNRSVNVAQGSTPIKIPRLKLDGADYAMYQSGSGTNKLTFTYTIAAGNYSSDMNYYATNSLGLNGGTIKDIKNSPVSLTLPPKTSINSLGYNKNIILDGNKPVITLSGALIITLNAGETYTEPGYSALDNFSINLTSDVVVSGVVDTSTQGTYTINYNVVDAAGNQGVTKTRTINVQ